ncbi:ATP-binding protein [Nitrosospira sp. NRS527]|uniref:ATP-binding protein n=1 Tax=Nitrosospira sp. NRS527 TaxID=155925 RepID=UPI001AF90195|nr:ATP-binding protein [Nitrosospira sp. NRS527]BCT67375.1 ATP-dependent zinc metalloprotease FtsH [Nitrosospira sp. NRS527]
MSAVSPLPVAFTPRLDVADMLAASWLTEITLRLRREICWLWQLRIGSPAPVGAVPPPANATAEQLDLTRFADDKRRFLDSDVTAHYLTEQIDALRTARRDTPGPWSAIVYRLALDDCAQFVLALGLLARTDPACGAIIGSCLNDMNRTLPTLALAQRLYDDPAALLRIDMGHVLFRFGLLETGADPAGWHQSFEMSSLIAHACISEDGCVPAELRMLQAGPFVQADSPAVCAAVSVLQGVPRTPQLVPLLGDIGCDVAEWLRGIAQLTGRPLVELTQTPLPDTARLTALAAWCWLHDCDVLLPPTTMQDEHQHSRMTTWPTAPVRWLAPLSDPQAMRRLPVELLQTPLQLPHTGFTARVTRLQRALGPLADGLDEAIEEMARRFRVPAAVIDAIGAAADALDAPLTAETLHTLCRARAHPDLGSLAQPVTPRFTLDELVLPPAQMLQLTEITGAMRALTWVHYHFGTARAWNDAGLSVLFCGPPGTGKTMAAEAIAHDLELPMFRIDLSQVVNKYIGETEKNLKRVFDAAEDSDCLMFFDEADALFGKRTGVKDAHDRFANIEISYLLERMERFKGIAVLATNRRKDLDEAFLRRLRYLIEFPLPGEAERVRLWRYVFPQAVDISELDIDYLARQFPLAGGHIRSIAFNACLQAGRYSGPRIAMPTVLFAVKRELDKLNRPNSPESFGAYRELILPLYDEARR